MKYLIFNRVLIVLSAITLYIMFVMLVKWHSGQFIILNDKNNTLFVTYWGKEKNESNADICIMHFPSLESLVIKNTNDDSKFTLSVNGSKCYYGIDYNGMIDKHGNLFCREKSLISQYIEFSRTVDYLTIYCKNNTSYKMIGGTILLIFYIILVMFIFLLNYFVVRNYYIKMRLERNIFTISVENTFKNFVYGFILLFSILFVYGIYLRR